MSQVKQVATKRIKKSKEAQQLLKSMKDTISLFQEQAERAIFIQIPDQVKQLDIISKHQYFTSDFEQNLIKQFNQIQDCKKPFIDEKTKTQPFILQPAEQFLSIESQMNDRVQNLQMIITYIRRSIETLQWKKRTSMQEEVQKAIIQQLEVTQQNLQQVTNLFLGYHEARADIVYALQKYGCIDYYFLLPILETKVCKALRSFVSDFRVHLLMLYDLLVINYDNLLGAEPKVTTNYGYM